MDTFNSQLVGMGTGPGALVVVMNPAVQMTPDQALLHAAWLVALAEPFATVSFDATLAAVRST